MRIKKYVAESMPEALKQVKADLGANAVILNTRTLRKGGKFGLGKGQVEVTAAIDEGKPPASAAKRTAPKRLPTASVPMPRAVATKRPASEPAVVSEPQWADRISRKLEGLEAALRAGVPRGGGERLLLPGALEVLSAQLTAAGLADALAQNILKGILLDPGPTGLKNLPPLQRLAADMLARWFEDPMPTRLGKGVRSVVALVGPAGVGKTTTAARLAAHFASETDARVMLVAADTDRVGGLEQLRAYAGILGVPVEVVYTPEEMGDVIRTRRDIDLVLIDTAGAGPLAGDQIARLNALLKEAAPNEVHLTLSAPTDFHQMRDVVTAYAPIGINRLLLTKIDETARLGAACALAVESKLPLSYTTHGRAVPGDLLPADPQQLAQDLFERIAHANG